MTTVVNYGAGTNSTAMLVGLNERGERPDVILFADTGGERPETYQHRDTVSDWCESVGFPRIITVRAPQTVAATLEADCLKRKTLPAIAFGFKTCSQRWKREPCEKWKRNNGYGDATSLIGIDADETRRAKDFPNTRYPLIEWWWGRDDCIDAIARAGLPQPGKSSCFFCPSMKAQEILQLKREHPELLARALAMEANAELTSVKGLGRSFSWAELVAYDEAQIDMFGHDSPGIPCECFDG